MPTTIRHEKSGQVRFAQDWEVESFQKQGWVVDESATQDADGINKNPDSGARADDDARPAKSASKADWEAYAATQGIDTDGLTKDEIIDAVG
jgi:hypothetical protein